MNLKEINKFIDGAESVKTEKIGPTVVHSIEDNPKTWIEEYYELIISTGDTIKKIKIDDLELNKKITSLQLKQILHLKKLELGNWLNWLDYKTKTCITFLNDEVVNCPRQIQVQVLFEPDLVKWKNNFSYHEYCHTLMNVIREGAASPITETSISTDEPFQINSKVNLIDPEILTIEESLTEIKNKLMVFHDKTITELEKENLKNSIMAHFTFPKEIEKNCEQYLLYFAQFLQDLGINATANLKEKAGKVLFSVSPIDENEALDKIREALAVYLNLPNSPIIFDDSFKSMRLQQQIENLQHSQRMAARELQFSEKLLAAQSDMLHEKNLTISQLQSVNEQQQKIIEKISSKSIMMDSIENKEELEEIYDGIKVGESESLKKWLGISLNPAKAIKTAVKNTLGKEDKKSVLGLDEE